ncbi:MAG: hypothetical protein KIS73_14145 [Enhydrobacter sp.]|nr:hypothetical protein [Enhydrobacter sp.]
MRRRKVKWLCARLKQLSAMKLTRQALLTDLGDARAKAPADWRIVDLEIAPHGTASSIRTAASCARPRSGKFPAQQPVRPPAGSAVAVLEGSLSTSWMLKRLSEGERLHKKLRTLATSTKPTPRAAKSGGNRALP